MTTLMLAGALKIRSPAPGRATSAARPRHETMIPDLRSRRCAPRPRNAGYAVRRVGSGERCAS